MSEFVEIQTGTVAAPYDKAISHVRKAAAWCWRDSWLHAETQRSMTVMTGVRGAAVHQVYVFSQAPDGGLTYSIRGARHMIRLGAPAQHNQIDNWAQGRLLQDCVNSHFTPEQIKAGEEARAKSYKP